MTEILAQLSGNLIPLIGTLLGLALTWLVTTLRKKVDEQAAQSRYAAATRRVLDLVVTFGQRVWPKLESEFQKAMADGSLDATERALLESIIKTEILALVKEEEIEKIAKDLGLPFAGVIAMMASRLIEMVVQASDPHILAVPQALFAPKPSEDTLSPSDVG